VPDRFVVMAKVYFCFIYLSSYSKLHAHSNDAKMIRTSKNQFEWASISAKWITECTEEEGVRSLRGEKLRIEQEEEPKPHLSKPKVGYPG
jgi:hypothetical protein